MCKSKKCGEIKPFSEFYNNKKTKDGKSYRCKECIKDVRSAKKHDSICENLDCFEPFKSSRLKTKFCESCRPQTRTKEQCHEIALKYNTPKEFKDNEPAVYNYASGRGWLDDIQSHMCRKRVQRTDEELKTEMIKYGSRVEFSNTNSNYYQQAKKKPWYTIFAQELWGDFNTGGWGDRIS